MKKFFYMAVAALAALSSCSSDNDPITGETVKQSPTFTATMEGGVTRATLNANKAQWEVDDQININGKAYKATIAGASTTLEAVTEGQEATPDDNEKFKAYFPASMYDGTTVTLPASYQYKEDKFDMPMYAESTTTELSFKNLCGVLAITVPQSEMCSVKSIVVSSDKQMNGEICSISAEGVLTFKTPDALTNELKKVTVTASEEVAIPAEGCKTFYVPVPANTHNPLTIIITNNTTTKMMTTKKSGGVAVERSKIYSISFADNTNAHLVKGLFSVSNTKTVLFTKSNLYWDGSAFLFEENPTDYPITRETTHVGHFFWSKTATNSYSTSNNASDATVSDNFFADGSDASHTLTADGINNLYILTGTEWTYLLNTRIDASNLHKYGVTVTDGTNILDSNCFIIAPDGATFDTSKTSYTLAELEAEGLVCLPTAGLFGGLVMNATSDGFYWSSTPHENNSVDAKHLHFTPYSAGVHDYGRNYGLSLRAVISRGL